MANRLAFLPEASAEAVEAYDWYEGQSDGLGERFRDHLDECIRHILRNPELFEAVYKQYRRAIVRDFPYEIYYECQGGHGHDPFRFSLRSKPEKVATSTQVKFRRCGNYLR